VPASRIVVERDDDARVLVDAETMRDAVVVVSAMDNVIGAVTPDLRDSSPACTASGGIVIVDAAQQAPVTPWSLCAVSTPTRSASRRTRCTDRRSASSSPP
jgi:selenocysteine lyase/cysteine desulfurase